MGEEALVLQPLPLPPAVLELISPGPGAPRDGGGGFQGPARGVEAAPPLQGPQPAQQAGGGGGGGGGDRGREPRPPVPLLPPHSTGEGETTERVPAIQFDQSFGICFYYPHLAPGTGPRPVELIIKNCNEKVSIISRDSFNNLLVWKLVTNRFELKNLSQAALHPAISCHYPFHNHVASTLVADILANKTGRPPFTLCKGGLH